MNYSAQLLDELAAHFALGTLRHAARTRFERLCDVQPAARAARERWEDRMLPLALELPTIAPSATCWPGILRLIHAATPGLKTKRLRLQWWQGALAASVLVAAFLTARFTVWNEPTWQAVAVLTQASHGPLWRLERSADSKQIHVSTIGTVALPMSQSYELWLLPPGAGHPVSLGLLPRAGILRRTLTVTQRTLLLAATKVAVSIEPAGGSPTGLPTGPVIIVAVIDRPA